MWRQKQRVVMFQKNAKEFDVLKLIEGYIVRGHLFTKTNPVRDRRLSPTLDIENFGLSSSDFKYRFLMPLKS
jgi:2-oxoglutarate dehydrogenase E1 component